MKVLFKYPREIDGKLYKPGEHDVDVHALSVGGKWFFEALKKCGDIGKPVPAALKKAQDVANRAPDYPLAGDGVNLAYLNALPTDEELETLPEISEDEVPKSEDADENFDGEHDTTGDASLDVSDADETTLPADNVVKAPEKPLTKAERKALKKAQRGEE